jgi:hypothetical protein
VRAGEAEDPQQVADRLAVRVVEGGIHGTKMRQIWRRGQ